MDSDMETCDLPCCERKINGKPFKYRKGSNGLKRHQRLASRHKGCKTCPLHRKLIQRGLYTFPKEELIFVCDHTCCSVSFAKKDTLKRHHKKEHLCLEQQKPCQLCTQKMLGLKTPRSTKTTPLTSSAESYLAREISPTSTSSNRPLRQELKLPLSSPSKRTKHKHNPNETRRKGQESRPSLASLGFKEMLTPTPAAFIPTNASGFVPTQPISANPPPSRKHEVEMYTMQQHHHHHHHPSVAKPTVPMVSSWASLERLADAALSL